MPFRPGPHPSRSECHSSGPQFIFINSSTDSSGQISYSDLSHSTTPHTADSVGELAVRFGDHDTAGLTSTSVVRTTDSSAISDQRDDGRVEATQTGPDPVIVSPVRSTYGGYYGLVVVTPPPPPPRPRPRPRPQTLHRSHDNLKNPYRIASIFYM